MKQMTKLTPIILTSLLGGGFFLFWLNGFFNVPVETWFAYSGITVFAAGMIFGLISTFRSAVMLKNQNFRQSVGVIIPILTIVITVSVWSFVITSVIRINKEMEKRAQAEQEYYEKHQEEKSEQANAEYLH
ncbi:hypothetical protein ACFLS1_12915 [Verrucomicrobiota bacterium]